MAALFPVKLPKPVFAAIALAIIMRHHHHVRLIAADLPAIITVSAMRAKRRPPAPLIAPALRPVIITVSASTENQPAAARLIAVQLAAVAACILRRLPARLCPVVCGMCRQRQAQPAHACLTVVLADRAITIAFAMVLKLLPHVQPIAVAAVVLVPPDGRGMPAAIPVSRMV